MKPQLLSQIEFSQLQEDDIHYLIRWLRQPHVQEYWPNQFRDEEIRKKYLKHIHSGWVFPYLIKIKNEPVGYIQCYQSWKEDGNWWASEKEGTYGIDLFLGEPEYLGKGYGSSAIRAFIEMIQKSHKVIQWIIDVDPQNIRALHCYQKVGFQSTGLIQTPEGEALLMRLSAL